MPDFDHKLASYSSQTDAIERGPFDLASDAFEKAGSLASRVCALADRLCGTIPQAVSGGGASASSQQPAVFNALRARSERVSEIVVEAHAALDRIERALP